MCEFLPYRMFDTHGSLILDSTAKSIYSKKEGTFHIRDSSVTKQLGVAERKRDVTEEGRRREC